MPCAVVDIVVAAAAVPPRLAPPSGQVEVSSKYGTVKSLVQQYLFVPAKHKDCYLTYVCNEVRPLGPIWRAEISREKPRRIRSLSPSAK